MLWFLITVLSLTVALEAHPPNNRTSQSLQGSWYHDKRHPVHDLFKRAIGADGQDYPEVGSPTWSAKYPVGTPNSAQLPGEWAAALKKAEDAGKIPKIPPSTQAGTYPNGVNPGSPEVCSATVKCINPGDIWEVPAGTFASTFDDGPLPSAGRLLDFLKSHGEHTTHFLIGVTILAHVDAFKAVIASGNDLAVHTYTHPQMTTLSNADIVAQLGWTMQIIHDSTGGKVPRYWRPPQGDSDNRVRAIAQEVFGLRTVIWNRDTFDWDIPHTTHQTIDAQYTAWLKGPKSPGILILEHELNDECIQIFMDHYPEIKANGWTFSSFASIADNNAGAYRNVANGQVKPANILNTGVTNNPSTPSNGTSTTQSLPGTGVGPSSPASSSPSAPASQTSNPASTPTGGAQLLRRDGFFLGAALGIVAFALSFP